MQAYGDARPLDAEEIRSWLRNEELEPEWLQVLEEDGRVVGYGDIWVQTDEVVLDVAAPGRWHAVLRLGRGRGTRARPAARPRRSSRGHELARDRRGARLPALAVVVRDGDRRSTRPPPERAAAARA